MILRMEWLVDQDDGSVVVLSAHEHSRLGGWPDAETASKALRAKASRFDPAPLICGGYETKIPNPNTGLRERITFWADNMERHPSGH
jgi:hypothetical protein